MMHGWGAGSTSSHRMTIPELTTDRHMTPDLEEMTGLVRGDALLGLVA